MKPYTRQVHYYETDKMAVMHHSNYIRIFEEARTDYMAQAGIPYLMIEGDGIFIPVVDVYAKYHTSLCYADTFSVIVNLTEFNGVRMAFSYEIRRASDNALAVSGYSSHCFIDAESRRPLNLKKRMPEAAEAVTLQLAQTSSIEK